ncbi:hypothetical protein DIJ64_00725 [Mycobacterium leprae]|uniref:Uncharacterized protein n=1 Tax=Mycobacterium leprae TaxID=1769 RepID=A0AAD0KPR4_MYCLR|nr:hypothetical protein DIJ64_00725 [Mycobacterium leprae]
MADVKQTSKHLGVTINYGILSMSTSVLACIALALRRQGKFPLLAIAPD